MSATPAMWGHVYKSREGFHKKGTSALIDRIAQSGRSLLKVMLAVGVSYCDSSNFELSSENIRSALTIS